MKLDKKDLLLYAVTDRSWLNGETLYSQVEKALKGGATFIQLREKDLDSEAFLKKLNDELDKIKEYMDIGEGTVEVSETADKDWINNWK